MAVNEGTEEAIKLMQRSAYGVPNGPDIDGKMGPMTISAINNASSNVISLLLNIVSWSTWYISQVLIVSPKDSAYVNGWLTRARKIPTSVSV